MTDWEKMFQIKKFGRIWKYGPRTVPAVAVKEIDSYTQLMLHMDGTDGSTTITDSSPTPKSMTAIGSGTISTTQSVFGGASYSGNAITTPDAAALNLGSSDFTIALRLRPTGAVGTMISQFGAAGNRGWYFYYDATTLQFAYSTNGTAVITLSVPWSHTTGTTWYALLLNRNGNNVYFYSDGTQVGTTQDMTGVTIFDSTQVVCIGADGAASTGDAFSGYIDELKFDVGIARHTADYAIPLGPYTT